MFPHFPVQHITECTHTNTLHYDPICFFDGTCHKTQSQTNRHPSIDRHSRCRKTPPPSIRLIITCALPPSIREAVWLLPIILGRACPLLREGAQSQFLSWSTFFWGSARHPNLGADVGGGLEAQDIGLLYGWGLLRLFRSYRRCKEVREEEVQELK